MVDRQLVYPCAQCSIYRLLLAGFRFVRHSRSVGLDMRVSCTQRNNTYTMCNTDDVAVFIKTICRHSESTDPPCQPPRASPSRGW